LQECRGLPNEIENIEAFGNVDAINHEDEPSPFLSPLPVTVVEETFTKMQLRKRQVVDYKNTSTPSKRKRRRSVMECPRG